VNDDVCGFFTPITGIGKGDPLSPYLFIICMEILIRTLLKATYRKKWGIGVKISSRASKFYVCLLHMIVSFFAELILNLVVI